MMDAPDGYKEREKLGDAYDPDGMRHESDVSVRQEDYQDNTMRGNLPLEATYAFHNNRDIWIDCHREDWYSLKNQAKQFKNEALATLRYKFGPKRYRGEYSGMKGKHSGPAVILASGASANKYMPQLKNWKGGIVCSNSQASTLVYHGADPTYMVIYDSKCKTEDTLDICKKWDYNKTSMIASVSNNWSFYDKWKGSLYYFRVYDPYIEWYKYLRYGYGWMEHHYVPFACSAAAVMGFAKYAGYDPIFTLGMDFGARRDEKSRFDTWRWAKSGWNLTEYYENFDVIPTNAPDYRTMALHLFYRRTTMAAYWLDAPNLIDCSDGLLNGLLPKIDFQHVLDHQGASPEIDDLRMSPAEIRANIAPFLVSQNQYWIVFGEDEDGNKKGRLFEADDWEHQIPMMLVKLRDMGHEVDLDTTMAEIQEQRAEARRRGYIMMDEEEPITWVDALENKRTKKK